MDIHECFAAMEQYRKTFSPLNLNSAFALYFESRVVTFNRLMNLIRTVLLQLSLYLDMGVVDGITRKVLSKQILKALLDGFTEILYFVRVVGWSFD